MAEVGDTGALDWSGPGGEALLRAMLDAANVFVGVFELLEDDYRCVLANRGAAAFYGLEDGGLNGLTGRDLGLSERQIKAGLETLRGCATTGQSRSIEYPFRPKGGPESRMYGTFSPLPGRPTLVSFVVIDITERRKAQEMVATQGARLALALEATGLGIWEYDIGADVVTWDARTRELFGATPGQAIDFSVFAGKVHPDDFPAFQAAYARALQGADDGRYEVEHRIVDDAGVVRWVRGAAQVFFDAAGKAQTILGTIQDVTEQVAARERQDLLVAELNHRVKNNLATVQAIASHTLRANRDDMAAFREAFQSRLFSLARGHELLTRTSWTTPDLAEVLQVALAPFETPAIVVDGLPFPVRLHPELAINMVMVLHELITNATKYGALTRDGGEVHVQCTIDEGALVVHWRERGGPSVLTPRASGFGTRLMTTALRGFNGAVQSEFAPDGYRCLITLPVGRAVTLDGTG